MFLRRLARRTRWDHTSRPGGYITQHEALFVYNVDLNQLDGVSTITKSDPLTHKPWTLYNASEVLAVALKSHGTIENIRIQRQRLPGQEQWREDYHYSIRRKRTVEPEEPKVSSQRFNIYTSQGVVTAAIYGSAAIAVLKLTAAAYSGSASLISESIRSIFDTLTQVTYGLGLYQSKRSPTQKHPYGFSQSSYFWSLQAGGGGFIAGIGGIFIGTAALIHPLSVEIYPVLPVILIIGIIADAVVLSKAVAKFRRDAYRYKMTYRQYLREAPDPSTASILAEDCVAICSGTVACLALGLTYYTGYHFYDAGGSIVCGSLTSLVAGFNIARNYRFLHNRSMPDDYIKRCVAILERNPVVSSVHDVKAVTMGADRYRFKAEIVLDSLQICRLTCERIDVDLSRTIVTKDFLEKFSSSFCIVIGDQIDEMEQTIRSEMPEVQHLDIEPV